MILEKFHGRGNHLIIDAKDVDKDLIYNKRLIKTILKELPSKINMHTLTKPKVIKATPKKWDTGGITGFVILSESNISIHTYPNEGKFYFDLFSCKEFDINTTVNYLKEKLKFTNFKKTLLKRGDY